MKYPLADIAEITGGTLHGNHPAHEIAHVLIDSRRLRNAEITLFFALVGERHNGHHYVADLAKRGVRAFVVQELQPVENNEVVQIVVPDTKRALQALAAHHRQQFDFPVIAITGSNGKTIVKEWLFHILGHSKRVVRSPKSYNSQVGVPLSVWLLNERHELAIIEAGISQPGEMARLQQIIKPTIGIFTNIGEAHSENFESHEAKAREKVQLFKEAEMVFYCRDHKQVHLAMKSIGWERTLSWSQQGESNLTITNVERSGRQARIGGRWKGEDIEVVIPFSDAASVENAITCWLVALRLGMPQQEIAERMTNLGTIAMRLEQRSAINHSTLINDAYNSDLSSLGIALDHLNQQRQHPRRTVILSDILQSGMEERALYAEVAAQINQSGIHKLIGIGRALMRQQKQFDVPNAQFFPSTDAFLEQIATSEFHNESILLKGAHSFDFQRIGKALEEQAHGTVLEINLTAMQHNLNYLKSKLPADTRIMAMVKAFSYGSGIHEVANLLQFNRVDYLAVAYADEGAELRRAGVRLPIMVMSPEPRSFDTILKYHLEPEIYSMNVLEAFANVLDMQLLAEQGPYPIHVKLDTGMHRLGFTEAELPHLADWLLEHETLTVRSVFSHLAGSDAPEHDAFTRKQIEDFKKLSNNLEQRLDKPFLRHILNSSGVQRFPDAAFDMARLGIGLYGVAANPAEQARLQPVSTLKTYIAQIKQIPAGETVGYGRSGKANEAKTIATVSIGYADGLRRSLSNGHGRMLVNGKFAPIYGKVCMDMTMLDITGIKAREGDEVIVFGDGYSLFDFARDLDTIPYEVLTGISRRVKRVYYQE